MVSWDDYEGDTNGGDGDDEDDEGEGEKGDYKEEDDTSKSSKSNGSNGSNESQCNSHSLEWCGIWLYNIQLHFCYVNILFFW